MKHLTSELPSDATSQHQTIKQKGIDCINKGLIQINEYLVKGLLATLAEVASPDGLVPKIPSSLTELCRFVKMKDVSVRSGKVDPLAKGFHLLPYLPFSHRAFFIYIADFIVALKIQRLLLAENMEEVCKPPYTAVLDFLEYTFAACDSNRIGNADVVSAAKPFMFLGCLFVLYCCCSAVLTTVFFPMQMKTQSIVIRVTTDYRLHWLTYWHTDRYCYWPLYRRDVTYFLTAYYYYYFYYYYYYCYYY